MSAPRRQLIKQRADSIQSLCDNAIENLSEMIGKGKPADVASVYLAAAQAQATLAATVALVRIAEALEDDA